MNVEENCRAFLFITVDEVNNNRKISVLLFTWSVEIPLVNFISSIFFYSIIYIQSANAFVMFCYISEALFFSWKFRWRRSLSANVWIELSCIHFLYIFLLLWIIYLIYIILEKLIKNFQVFRIWNYIVLIAKCKKLILPEWQ